MDASVCDRILVKVKETESVKEYEGLYMPSVDENYYTIKLDNGYNVGIKKNNVIEIKILKQNVQPSIVKGNLPKQNPDLPTISILHTGGTIASKVDYETGGTVSRFTPEEIVAMFPEIKKYANVKSRLIKNMWSQDMRFSHYNLIAQEVKKELESGAKGVIVTQGTDTMHYTSAGLAFILENLKAPVILVGAQRSSDRGSSDAYMNLINAVYFIVNSNFGEVGICMHANSGDDYCHILPATKTRKLHTSRRDAFRPINTVPWAEVDYVQDKIKFLKNDYIKSQESSGSNIELKLIKENVKVAILKQHTNMYAEQFLFYKDYHGLVIEATGLGCLPMTKLDNSTCESGEILNVLKMLIKNEVVVVEAPQTINGRIVMNVYSDQRLAQEIGVLGNFSDMTPETTFIKLAWLLSNYSKEDVRELIVKNLRGEISESSDIRAFLYK